MSRSVDPPDPMGCRGSGVGAEARGRRQRRGLEGTTGDRGRGAGSRSHLRDLRTRRDRRLERSGFDRRRGATMLDDACRESPANVTNVVHNLDLPGSSRTATPATFRPLLGQGSGTAKSARGPRTENPIREASFGRSRHVSGHFGGWSSLESGTYFGTRLRSEMRQSRKRRSPARNVRALGHVPIALGDVPAAVGDAADGFDATTAVVYRAVVGQPRGRALDIEAIIA